MVSGENVLGENSQVTFPKAGFAPTAGSEGGENVLDETVLGANVLGENVRAKTSGRRGGTVLGENGLGRKRPGPPSCPQAPPPDEGSLGASLAISMPRTRAEFRETHWRNPSSGIRQIIKRKLPENIHDPISSHASPL